jgi:molybdopterin-guanine dinucleotide biosynthesis protein A
MLNGICTSLPISLTNDPLKYVEWNLHVVTDLFSTRSSLTGIHAGLFHCTHPYAFCVGCDTPFLEKPVVEAVIAAIDTDSDVVIPQTASGLEPLCAVYAKRCLNAIEKNLNRSQLKIQCFFEKVRVKKIPEKTFRRLDPQLRSFFNINTPADLAQAEDLCTGH